jgi:hypothetical protein
MNVTDADRAYRLILEKIIKAEMEPAGREICHCQPSTGNVCYTDRDHRYQPYI